MDLIGKKYRVLKSLGQGAMGEVFLVLPPRGDPVALKLLKTAESSNQKAALEQFENEFKVLKKLSHPNIGRIHDYGYDEDQKKVYFTSPWLKGKDLLAATKDVPFEKCEDYFIQILRALNYLHQKGIIHCDLKPGNIFVEKDQILLIDFGLAGYWGESIVGTPTYLAPEVFRGEHHSILSDLYALGVIFYNCISRTQPFSGKSLQEVYDRHRTHTPIPLHEINSKTPKYFADIALTLLAKKASERFPSAAAVIEEIAAYSKTKYSIETPETLLSYLPTTSELIGRKEIQWRLERQVGQFLNFKGKTPYTGVFLYGEHGVGKTKFVSQVKTRLQLEKIPVETPVLPLGDSDRKVLDAAQALILEDVGDYIDESGSGSGDTGRARGEPVKRELGDFLSFLEQKILSPQTSRLLFVVTGTKASQWEPFSRLFPEEEFSFEMLVIPTLNQEETRTFLETAIGQKKIPDSFVEEVFRNTSGNPGICQQIIENLIHQGLLFDESGRWSDDLLTHLEDTLKKVDTPGSLEEQLKIEYESFTEEEREVATWLALSPYGLEEKALERLTGKKVGRLLKTMVDRKIVRQEASRRYFLYRTVFNPFIHKIRPLQDQRSRHSRLAEGEVGLSDEEVWYHQSYGTDRMLMQTALEHLGDHLSKQGKKEMALECYERLNQTFVDIPIPQRVEWAIKASENLIWLDRFGEAVGLLSSIEEALRQGSDRIPEKSRLTLLEKKGLALLHMQKIDDAKRYFNDGLKLAASLREVSVEEIRFANDLAQIELITGFPERAIPKFIDSRKKSTRLSKVDLQQITNNDLGHVYYRLGDYEKAIALLNEDIKIFLALPNHEPLARALYSLAECYRAEKKYGKAVKEYDRCIQICQQESLFPILLRAYNGLGNIYLVNQKFEEALDSYQRAIEISVRVKDPTTKAALLANQGLIYRNQKNWTQSSRRFLLAKQILESKKEKLAYEHELLSKCYNELTEIAKEEKNKLKALSFQLERMRMVENSETLKPEEFSVKLELAELYLANRLSDPFQVEIKKLTEMAKTEEEKRKVLELREQWVKIQGYDQESTMKAPG